MKKRRYARHLLVFIALCLVVFVGIRIYLSRTAAIVQSSQVAEPSRGSDLEMTEVAFTETENGQPVWSLEAARANYRKSGQVVDLEDVKVAFYGPDRAVRSRVTASRASADLESRRVVAQDNVVLITSEGGRLRTEWLEYRHPDKTISTDRRVVFVHLGARIEGQGMFYSLDDKFLRLDSSISAQVPFDYGH